MPLSIKRSINHQLAPNAAANRDIRASPISLVDDFITRDQIPFNLIVADLTRSAVNHAVFNILHKLLINFSAGFFFNVRSELLDLVAALFLEPNETILLTILAPVFGKHDLFFVDPIDKHRRHRRRANLVFIFRIFPVEFLPRYPLELEPKISIRAIRLRNPRVKVNRRWIA